MDTNKKDLASLLNTTREIESRRLSAFQRERDIEMIGKRMIIKNYDALENLLWQDS
ncbi:helix-turn-helix domain-containing protein [Lysinibacillus sp. ACHW1.5]|uniref:helix-turn-helix domain-containing protein n=1 Tax=Lysinibacillus sp. ACHW1.5 TaxID=2913506 RepID=UPI0021126E9B|nr:helix-turn-helix domain-containing protein [Lysinibacillus sp. ACHW1.5]